MSKRASLLAALISALIVSAAAQPPRPAPPTVQQPTVIQPQPPAPTRRPAPTPDEVDEDEVVRITTNLVQVDAVVTDKDGRQVTGLTADDFEVEENGRARQITNFSYIRIEPATGAAAATAPAPA
ncbi:MAG TPA: hypothetical protein VIP46_06660, partial [Pyrinomonadaceae bacterium]